MCIERVKAEKVTCCMQTLFSGLSSSRGQLHILSALYKYKAKKISPVLSIEDFLHRDYVLKYNLTDRKDTLQKPTNLFNDS